MSTGFGIGKRLPQNTAGSRSHRSGNYGFVTSLLAAVLFLTCPAAVLAGTDVCSVLKPEDIAKIFGSTFGAPTRQATPPGPFAGSLVRCEYTGNKLTFALTMQEYPNSGKRDVNWTARHTRWPSMMHAVELPGVGDTAMYTHNKIWSNKGLRDYEFSIVMSSKEHKDQLLALAKLFYGRL